MALKLAEAYVEINGRMGNLRSSFRNARQMAANAVRGINRELQNIGRVATRTLAIGGAAGAAGAFGLLKLAADAESAEVAMTTMLGSAEKAKTLLGELRDFAASTPFQFPELRQAAQLLLAFGETEETVIPALRRIGDVAAGTGQSVGEIAEIYGKARVQGRLFAEDVNQFTGRGINVTAPIAEILTESTGQKVTESDVKQLVAEGKVGFAELEEAFRRLTDEGGRFFNLTAALSQTLAGRFSTLKDNITQTFTGFGTDLAKTLNIKEVLVQLTDFTQLIQGEGVTALKEFAARHAVQIKLWTQWTAVILGVPAALGVVALALSAIMSPLVLVAGLLVAGTAAFLEFGVEGKNTDEKLANFGEGLIGNLDKMIKKLHGARDAVADWLVAHSNVVSQVLDQDARTEPEIKARIRELQDLLEREKDNILRVASNEIVRMRIIALQDRLGDLQGEDFAGLGEVQDELQKKRIARDAAGPFSERVARAFAGLGGNVETQVAEAEKKAAEAQEKAAKTQQEAQDRIDNAVAEQEAKMGAAGEDVDGAAALDAEMPSGRRRFSFTGAEQLAQQIQQGLTRNPELEQQKKTAENTKKIAQESEKQTKELNTLHKAITEKQFAGSFAIAAPD